MRERASGVGGRLTIGTSANHGTEIKIVIPGSIAFRRPRPSPLDKVKTIFDRVDKN
jgi:signal transduction histidine kinase